MTANQEQGTSAVKETDRRHGPVYAMAIQQFESAAEKIGLDDASRVILSEPQAGAHCQLSRGDG